MKKLYNSLGCLIPTIIYFLIFFGWGYNIIKLTKADFKEPYKEEVLRIIGIPIVPLGVILGYINFDNERTN